jgi:hypothetical protein
MLVFVCIIHVGGAMMQCICMIEFMWFSAGGAHPEATLTGVTVGVDVSASEKIWRTFQSLGDIAFAYSYSNVLIEIQVN